MPVFIYILVAASLQLLLLVISLITISLNSNSSRTNYYLYLLQFINTFCLSVILALNATFVTLQHDYIVDVKPDRLFNLDPTFHLFMQLSIADVSLTFTFEFIYSGLMYFTALKEYQYDPSNGERRTSEKKQSKKTKAKTKKPYKK